MVAPAPAGSSTISKSVDAAKRGAGLPARRLALSWLARHLALPKSSTSVLVKDLERRGFVRRARDARDERRLAIVLTGDGRRRLAADTVLQPGPLAQALAALPERRRAALLAGMEALADAAERLS